MGLINLIQKFNGFLFASVLFLLPKRKSRGQAAITDAIFFLLIVTGLAVFLFSFNATYGNSVNERFNAMYSQSVAIDSIKSILYSSVSRKNINLYAEDEEIYVDYFLALMKEDYAVNKQLSDETKTILANNVMRVLSPLSPSEDFMFLIYESKTASQTPFFVLLHLTKDNTDDGKTHHDFVCTGPQRNFSDVLPRFRRVLLSSKEYFTPINLFEISDLGRDPDMVQATASRSNGIVLLSLWKGYPFCYLINQVNDDGNCNPPEQWIHSAFNWGDWDCKYLVLDEGSGVYKIQNN